MQSRSAHFHNMRVYLTYFFPPQVSAVYFWWVFFFWGHLGMATACLVPAREKQKRLHSWGVILLIFIQSPEWVQRPVTPTSTRWQSAQIYTFTLQSELAPILPYTNTVNLASTGSPEVCRAVLPSPRKRGLTCGGLGERAPAQPQAPFK